MRLKLARIDAYSEWQTWIMRKSIQSGMNGRIPAYMRLNDFILAFNHSEDKYSLYWVFSYLSCHWISAWCEWPHSDFRSHVAHISCALWTCKWFKKKSTWRVIFSDYFWATFTYGNESDMHHISVIQTHRRYSSLSSYINGVAARSDIGRLKKKEKRECKEGNQRRLWCKCRAKQGRCQHF